MAKTQGDQAVSAPPEAKKKSFWQFEIRKRRIPREEIMHFSRQLGAFIHAGVPILEAIHVIEEEADNKTLRELLQDVSHALRAGSSISSSLAPHSHHFPPFYISMIRAAELTGHLDDVLEQLANYLERDLEVRRKIRSAMAYPFVVILMSMVTILVLTVFALPRFKTFFESLNAKLPLPTRMLLATTGFLGRMWWAVLAGIVGSTVLVLVVGRSDKGRLYRDRLLLRLPLVRGLVRHAIIERVARILSSMLSAGVPLLEALTVSADASNNRIYKAALLTSRDAILQGQGVARPIAATGLFPGSVVQMIRVGEDSGTLPSQLETAARFYERELEYKLKRFTTLFEPAVMIFVGIIVGFVALALVSAMYGIYRQVQV